MWLVLHLYYWFSLERVTYSDNEAIMTINEGVNSLPVFMETLKSRTGLLKTLENGASILSICHRKEYKSIKTQFYFIYQQICQKKYIPVMIYFIISHAPL